ncbi:MAG: protein kinase domain-containing protein [Planctomycetota bacterium]
MTGHLRGKAGISGDISLPSEDLPADSIAGPASETRYHLLGEIARGGMGAIVKLVDNDIRRPVAMKVILGDDVKERVERFVEEAQVTGQLEHPNIVPVHELGLNHEGKVYFTMKLVKGESLDAIIDAVADKDPEAVRKYRLSHLLQIFLKVCDAIAFAHSKGVIHRDLKPENVMVGRFGEVLVMDWGLAKVKGREDTASEALVETIRSEKAVGRTLSGEVMGTPSYMPPEQAAGKVERIDERSDVFALGAMLYKILTHEVPYAGSHVTEVLKKAVQCAYKVPRVKSPWNRIPKALQSICMRAMAGRKEDRYASVEGMVEDIRAYLDHRPVMAHRAGLLSRILRFMQRHPAGSLAGGVALILLSIGGAMAGILLQRAEAERARAREKEAQADAEGARAEAAAVRAQLAEEARAKAEVRATDAEDALKKGRLVSAVLRSANVELGGVLKRLKRSFYTSPTLEAKQAAGDVEWAKVEAFERNVPKDTASQAAWLAAKGWLRWYAGYEEESRVLLRRSREVDPDVGHGLLFEGTIWLGIYVTQQVIPTGFLTHRGVEFRRPRGENPLMKLARENLDEILRRVAEKKVWGESSAEDFREVLESFRGFQRGDLAVAERALSKALSVPELVWLRDEILYTRAKVRYASKRFLDGIEDVDKYLENIGRFHNPLQYKGLMCMGEGLQRTTRGEDPRECYEKAITLFQEVLEKAPGFPRAYSHRGMAYRLLAEAKILRGGDPGDLFDKALVDLNRALEEKSARPDGYCNRGEIFRLLGVEKKKRGEDPRTKYRSAIEDFTTSLRIDPDYDMAYMARGRAYRFLGETQAERGEDFRDALRKAVEDCDEAITRRFDLFSVYLLRGRTKVLMGECLSVRGVDPGKWIDEGLADCSEALRLDPEDPTGLNTRGHAYRVLGAAQADRGKDPRESFEKAIADFTKALALDSTHTDYYNNRGLTYFHLGQALKARKEDPSGAYGKAVEDCTEALRRNPENLSAYNNRGNAYTRLGEWKLKNGSDPREDFKRALADYDEILKRNPMRWQAWANKGLLYEKLARNREAAEAYEKAKRIFGRDNPYLNQQLERARFFSRVAPWAGQLQRGEFHKMLGEHDRALECFKEGFDGAAAWSGQKNTQIRRILIISRVHAAASCTALSRFKEAVGHLRKAFEEGWRDVDRLRQLPELAPLYDLPEFLALEKEWRARKGN